MLTPTHQADLFNNSRVTEPIVLRDDGLDATYQPDFIDVETACSWYEQLLTSTTWQQDIVTVYGKMYRTPRLSCWMGESWMTHSYSKQTMRPHLWQCLPLQIKSKIEAATGETFNSVLLNYYRDDQDSNGWHSDDEPELGNKPGNRISEPWRSKRFLYAL